MDKKKKTEGIKRTKTALSWGYPMSSVLTGRDIWTRGKTTQKHTKRIRKRKEEVKSNKWLKG